MRADPGWSQFALVLAAKPWRSTTGGPSEGADLVVGQLDPIVRAKALHPRGTVVPGSGPWPSCAWAPPRREDDPEWAELLAAMEAVDQRGETYELDDLRR